MFCALFVSQNAPQLLAAAGVAAHELVDATSGVNELALTGVEGVRAGGDFELHYGISLAFELHGVVRLGGGAAQEHVAITHVLEHDGAIVVGMNTLFHCLKILLPGLCTGGEYLSGLCTDVNFCGAKVVLFCEVTKHSDLFLCRTIYFGSNATKIWTSFGLFSTF